MLLQDTVQTRAAETPHLRAIVSEGRTVSYAELDRRSTQVARLLIDLGCVPGDRIGLLIPKSIEAIIGMIGALKAGCIYVPMDTHSPAARLIKIVEACEPACILTARATALLEQLQATLPKPIHIGLLDADAPATGATFGWQELDNVSSEPLSPRVNSSDPAHILFTSGSTGIPKGVVITHDNVIEFLRWANPYFGIEPGDRNSCHPPLHFDLSTFDIYGTFLAGAELHLVGDQTSLLPGKLANFVRASELTQWFSVPSALKFMAQFDVVANHDFPSLKRILWCGEALPTPTLIYWMNRLPHVQFTNLYGPTEATIASSFYTVPSVPERPTDPIPIGTACGGERLDVLTDELTPVPTATVGDLYIGGVGLSPGYWCDPEKTAAAFRIDANGDRWYKTGDLARRGADGLFYLLGRSDTQIKSRGYRIELGEIESALQTMAQIRECAVVAIPSSDFDGNTICCAYVRSGAACDASHIREQLSALLPSYMLPTRWLELAAMPLNGNGKIDKPHLRALFESKTVAA